MPKVGETRSDGKVYTGPKYGWQSTGTVWKKTPGNPGDKKTVGGVTKVYTGPKYGWQTQATIDKRQKPTPPTATPPAAPAPAPSGTPPAPAPAPSRTPSAPAPAPSRTPSAPAPAASPVSNYMKAAAAARKSGDPAEMAKVRDMGMDIWRKSNPKLSAAADEKARIRGTAQTDNPLMKDMRSSLPLTPSVQSPTLKKDLGNLAGNYTSLTNNPNAAVAATPKPVPVTRNSVPLQNPTVSEPLKPAEKPVKKTISSSYQYDAYDLVLEYLLLNGHVDTLEEANYVMMQMDSEHIQNIVEAERVLAQRTVNGVTSPGYVNVQKQGGFLGIGGRNVPVQGSFRAQPNLPQSAVSRYNQAIDTRYGTGSNANAMPAMRVQQRAQNQGNSGYMNNPRPGSVPNTGAADRQTPQRAGDQNRALSLLRPNVPVSPVKPAPKPAAFAGTPIPNSQLSPSEKRSLDAVRQARAAGSPTGAPGTSAARPGVPAPAARPATPAPAARPGAPAPVARPGAPAPAARPATPAPAAKPGAPAPVSAAPAPKLSKIQQGILDLRQMRADSLNRQGDVAGSQKLQSEVDVARASQKMPSASAMGSTPSAAAPIPQNKTNVAFDKQTPQLVKPATPTAAINAAGKLGPGPSGSVVPATNKAAAAPKPITLQPEINDGKTRDVPLWDMKGDKPQPPKKQPPMRDEPLW